MKRVWFGIFCLILIWPVMGNTGPVMDLDQLHKYVNKKIKRNEAVLQIKSKTIGDEGAIFLANSPLLQKVRKLVLNDTGITDTGIRALSKSAFLGNLKILDLGHNQIRDRGVQALAQTT